MFSSSQDGSIAFGKTHTCSVPSLSNLPKAALSAVLMFVWLKKNLSRPSRVKYRPLAFSAPQTRCDACCAFRSICLFTPSISDTARARDPQKSLQPRLCMAVSLSGQLIPDSSFCSRFMVPVGIVCLLVGCLTSQQHASVSQGRICTDNFTCCHTEIEAADQTFHLTQSQYTDTGPTSPSADPITSGAWQGSHWTAHFEVTGMTRPRKTPGASGIRTRDLPLSRRTP